MSSPLTCSCSSALPQVMEVSFALSEWYQNFLFSARHAKASHEPRSPLQNLSMSSYYRSMSSSRRLTVSFFRPQNCDSFRGGRTCPSRVSFLYFASAELLKKEKIIVDCKVYLFAMGMAQAFFKPSELPVLKQ